MAASLHQRWGLRKVCHCEREIRIDLPPFVPARASVELIPKGHEPFPALAVDRHRNISPHELARATFFPADDFTREALLNLA